MNQIQKAASLLGRQNLGKKKVNITPEDRAQKIERLAEARKKRWPNKWKNHNDASNCWNAHHLESWCSCVSKRIDEANMETVCNPCHTFFHHMYGDKSTPSQFNEFKGFFIR